MSDLFRSKSMEKVNSPEQLNDYIRVSNPSVWMILAAVIILLVGVCVWGIFGHLDTTAETVGVCMDGTITCYIREADISDVVEGTPVSVGDTELAVSEVAAFPVTFGSLLTASDGTPVPSGTGYAPEDMVYSVTIAAPDMADGLCDVSVILRRETPMSFVLN